MRAKRPADDLYHGQDGSLSMSNSSADSQQQQAASPLAAADSGLNGGHAAAPALNNNNITSIDSNKKVRFFICSRFLSAIC